MIQITVIIRNWILPFRMTFVLLLQCEVMLLDWGKQGRRLLAHSIKSGLERHERALYVVSSAFLLGHIKVHLIIFTLLKCRGYQDLLARIRLDQKLVGAVS